jgi:hypothetical protein
MWLKSSPFLTLQKILILGQAHKEDNYADLSLGCTDKKG